jgi:hypothetical protein
LCHSPVFRRRVASGSKLSQTVAQSRDLNFVRKSRSGRLPTKLGMRCEPPASSRPAQAQQSNSRPYRGRQRRP